MPKKDPTYERIERALYKDKDESTTILSPREMEIKKRMMLCVSKWKNHLFRTLSW